MQVRVYPEYFDPQKLSGVGIEVFAELVCRRSRMSLRKNGSEKISYEKMWPDEKCEAGPADQPIRPFRHGSIAMGLLCCRDLANTELSHKVKTCLDDSGCANKVILVSAEMTRSPEWGDGEELPGFKGYTVVLSDGGDGRRSFIAGIDGRKTVGSPVMIDGVTFQVIDRI